SGIERTRLCMKALHKSNLYSWSVFNEERNLDFHSVLWASPHGNVVIDPLPLSEHDRRHVEALGGVQEIFITTSDHVRGAAELAKTSGAHVWAPPLELERLARLAPRPARDGTEPVPGLQVFE